MSQIKSNVLTGVAVAAMLSIPLILQWRNNRDLRNEAAALHQVAAAAPRPYAVSVPSVSEAELARLRSEHLELMRLRGQVALLRSQVRNQAADSTGNSVALPDSQPAVAPPAPLVSAAFNARVPAGQTLVSGGWVSEPGKRIFMLSTPANVANQDSVLVQCRLVEVSETTWNQLGWEQLRGEQELQGLLDASQTDELLKSFAQREGIKILAAPRAITSNGQEARFSVGPANDVVVIPAKGIPAVSIGMTPQRSPDGSSFDLSLNVQLNRPGDDSPRNESPPAPGSNPP